MEAVFGIDGYTVIEIDPQRGYKCVEIDETGDPAFWGFEAASGAWLIYKKDLTTNALRYCSGSTGFLTCWNNRASLAYDYPSRIRWY